MIKTDLKYGVKKLSVKKFLSVLVFHFNSKYCPRSTERCFKTINHISFSNLSLNHNPSLKHFKRSIFNITTQQKSVWQFHDCEIEFSNIKYFSWDFEHRKFVWNLFVLLKLKIYYENLWPVKMNFHVQGEYTRKLELLAASYHSIYKYWT